MQGQADLLEIVLATGAIGGFAQPLHGRHHQPDQDRNNRDHDEQFDQRKASMDRAPKHGKRDRRVYGSVVKYRTLNWPKSAMSIRPSLLKSKIGLNSGSAASRLYVAENGPKSLMSIAAVAVDVAEVAVKVGDAGGAQRLAGDILDLASDDSQPVAAVDERAKGHIGGRRDRGHSRVVRIGRGHGERHVSGGHTADDSSTDRRLRRRRRRRPLR